MAKAKETKQEFAVKLEMNGMVYTAHGATVKDALDNLGIDYTKVKTKGFFTVSKGTQSIERFVQLPKLRRYFASKLLLSGLIRDFEKLLA